MEHRAQTQAQAPHGDARARPPILDNQHQEDLMDVGEDHTDESETGSLIADDADDEEEEERGVPAGHVRLRPSQFRNVPPTIFVDYPPELGVRREDLSVIEALGNRKLGYKCYWERVCIKNAHTRAGFVKSEKHWTSLWSKHQNESQIRDLNCLQKVNHFPASWCIGRKDRLVRTLNAMKRTVGGGFFDFHPETFVLPAERESLHRAVRQELSKGKKVGSMGGLWILKPPASSCGQGIKVVTGQQAAQIPKKKKAIVQKYLHRPYLIEGKKFDLRIYVLVAGVDPLRVYIHDEGLTRISTSKYSLKNISDRYAHLTNYSINKNAPNFKAAAFTPETRSSKSSGVCGASGGGNDSADGVSGAAAGVSADPEQEGFKWSLAAFRRWLAAREGQVVMERCFDKIFDLCLKTMIAAESEITPHLHAQAQYRGSCFELFGCDVILDEGLEPHLLEVNVSPSLMGSSPLDKKIKGLVIADTLHIVGMYPHDPAMLRRYGGGLGGQEGEGASLSKGNNIINKSNINSSNGHSSSGSGSNPFIFSSLSQLMHSQEAYRRHPCPETVDLHAVEGDSWLLLLLAEDELSRARHSKFHLVHPTPQNASHYCQLYRNCRFSDHLLAHWVISGGSAGRFGSLVPARYRQVQGTGTGTGQGQVTQVQTQALQVRRVVVGAERGRDHSRDSRDGRDRGRSASRSRPVSAIVTAPALFAPGSSKGVSVGGVVSGGGDRGGSVGGAQEGRNRRSTTPGTPPSAPSSHAPHASSPSPHDPQPEGEDEWRRRHMRSSSEPRSRPPTPLSGGGSSGLSSVRLRLRSGIEAAAAYQDEGRSGKGQGGQGRDLRERQGSGKGSVGVGTGDNVYSSRPVSASMLSRGSSKSPYAAPSASPSSSRTRLAFEATGAGAGSGMQAGVAEGGARAAALSLAPPRRPLLPPSPAPSPRDGRPAAVSVGVSAGVGVGVGGGGVGVGGGGGGGGGEWLREEALQRQRRALQQQQEEGRRERRASNHSNSSNSSNSLWGSGSGSGDGGGGGGSGGSSPGGMLRPYALDLLNIDGDWESERDQRNHREKGEREQRERPPPLPLRTPAPPVSSYHVTGVGVGGGFDFSANKRAQMQGLGGQGQIGHEQGQMHVGHTPLPHSAPHTASPPHSHSSQFLFQPSAPTPSAPSTSVPSKSSPQSSGSPSRHR
ncbi:tubulin-tyrosine ligase family-domain-containing protein [Ochromonadaceae sp. CCMP2298]|nr:tubulin-tyrosine ligase family-domain-containing protein [Ochromonadaceae sp. CCMP2298]